MLQRYGTANHEGGITEFALLQGAILLIFRNGAAYLYTDEVPGSAHVERMRGLAVRGKGLSTYVSRHIGTRYAQMLSAAEVAAVRAQMDGAMGAAAASVAVRP